VKIAFALTSRTRAALAMISAMSISASRAVPETLFWVWTKNREVPHHPAAGKILYTQY
jgi:hypothetical protein